MSNNSLMEKYKSVGSNWHVDGGGAVTLQFGSVSESIPTHAHIKALQQK